MAIRVRSMTIAVILLFAVNVVSAHHSQALFDMTRSNRVVGTVAKLEWTNPHIFIWLYVPDSTQQSGFRLYAVESGSVALMAREGWDGNSLAQGDKVTVDYMPLKDGRPGGALLQVIRTDGKTLVGDPLVVQAAHALPKRDQK